MKIKYLVHIIVIWVVTSDGDVIPPLMLTSDLILNIEAYIKYLEDVVVPWIVIMIAGRLRLATGHYMHI